MLPKYFKLIARNSGDSTIEFGTAGANNTLTIQGYGIKGDGIGGQSFGSDTTLLADPSSDLVAGGSAVGTEIDNSTGYLAFFCTVEILSDAADADGQIDILLEWASASASATDYPSDATDVVPAQDAWYITSIQIGAGASVDRHASFVLTIPVG